MNRAKSERNNYLPERAYLDLRSMHVQTAVGMLALFCICLVNFLKVHHPLADFYATQYDLIIAKSLLYDFTSFAFYFISCLLTALIVLKLSGKFGNRIGATAALWAALLFCLFPKQLYWFLPSELADRFLSTLILLIVVLFLRFFKKS